MKPCLHFPPTLLFGGQASPNKMADKHYGR